MGQDVLAGRTVLVTGGTGSFGRRFVEVVLRRHAVRQLVVLSRDALKQAAMQRDAAGHPALRFVLGDVRDRDRLLHAFRGVDVVVHAAALKSVRAAEHNPWEAVRTNVIGAQNVVDAAIERGVPRVLALSSGLAADPTSLYGTTRLLADRLFVAGPTAAPAAETQFAVVRCGNVMEGPGGAVPLFRMLRATGHIHVADLRATRFWVTLDQAVDFVVRCLGRMRGGEIFVPKSPSLRLVDLATAVAPECIVDATGLAPGEKLHEVMITAADARHTVEFGDHYVVRALGPRRSDDAGGQGGHRVADDFSYASDGNDQWLTPAALRALLDESGDAASVPRLAMGDHAVAG